MLSTMPTLEEISAFDAILAFNDYDFPDPAGMGNMLADYVDAGGGLVVAQFMLGPYTTVQGRLLDDGYMAIIQ